MGLFDTLTGRHKVKGPAADRLFAITTASVTLSAAHQIEPGGAAAVVFQPLATSEFDAMLRDMVDVVKATGADSGAEVQTRDDEYGYRWMVVRSSSIEDLAVALNAVSSSIETAGYGERLLAAVFAFADAHGQRIYFIYNYKRGTWYPFVPAAQSGTRNTERELQLKAQMDGELPLESELERWFPLWGAPI